MSRLSFSRCLFGLGIALLVAGVVFLPGVGLFLILVGLGALAAGVALAGRRAG